MRRAEAQAIVHAPAERIWELYADLEGTPRWVPFVTEIVSSSGPLEVGMVYRERTHLAGLSGVQEWRVAELEAPRRRVDISSELGMDSRLTIELEPGDGATLLRQVSEISSRLPRPLGWLHELIVAPVVARAMAQAIEGARSQLEHQD